MIKRIVGKVVHGKKRGKKLGFPTANIKPFDPNDLLIKHGAYVSLIIIQFQPYMALTSIEKALTFDAEEIKIEPHILDFNKNIYGYYVTVILIKRLRNMIKFPSSKELVAQFEKDCVQIRRFFDEN